MGEGGVREWVGIDAGLQAGVGCVGLGHRVLPPVLRLQGPGSAWGRGGRVGGGGWSVR